MITLTDVIEWYKNAVESGEIPGTREQRAEALLRDMYMAGREACEVGIDEHNPYAWGEANPELMRRLKEFM